MKKLLVVVFVGLGMLMGANAGTIPDSENTYVALYAATNLYHQAASNVATCIIFRRSYAGVSRAARRPELADMASVRSRIDAIVADNAEFLAAVSKAAALPSYCYVNRNDDPCALPPISFPERLSGIMQLKIIRNVERKEYAAALSTIKDLLAIGRKMRDNASSGGELVTGTALCSDALTQARLMSANDDVPNDVLSALAEAIVTEVDADVVIPLVTKREFVRAVKLQSRGKKGALDTMPDSEVLKLVINRDRVATRAAQIVIAAARYRRDNNGAKIPSLAALSPKYIAAEPMDPFAKEGGFQFDAYNQIAWSVSESGSFAVAHNFSMEGNRLYSAKFMRYAIRLDGKMQPIGRKEER